MLSRNCQVELISKDLFLGLNRPSNFQILTFPSNLQNNHNSFLHQYNDIGITAKTADQGRRKKFQDHAIITKASYLFQSRTGFVAGDIISQIGNHDTSKITNDDLQVLLRQTADIESYRFIKNKKYFKVQQRKYSFSKFLKNGIMRNLANFVDVYTLRVHKTGRSAV
jgi:hypothetical protein